MNNFREKANFIWSIADLLRCHYKQADYGKVILPFTVLRRLDMVLEPTKKQVLVAYQKHKAKKPEVLEPILNGIAKVKFHNHSKFDFNELAKDHNNIAANLRNYINGFSISAREIIDYFSFEDQIKKLDEYDLLYLVIKHFAEAKERFEVTDPMEMAYIFEEGLYCKIFDNEDFGYQRITVERPKRKDKGEIEKDKKGEPVPDADLRDFENVSLKENVEKYFMREVLPHLPDAWIDHSKTKIGYEINFTKYFYKYKPLRNLEEIRKDILALEEETDGILKTIINYKLLNGSPNKY